MADQPPTAPVDGGNKKGRKKEKQVKPPPPGGYAKKPQLTKAERREMQEKQRALKAQAQKDEENKKKTNKSSNSNKSSGSGGSSAPVSGGGGGGGASKSGGESSSSSSKGTKSAKQVQQPKQIFDHLTSYSLKNSESIGIAASLNDTHPAIASLGLRFANGSIRGANARCFAMLEAMKEVVRDYSTPPDKALERDLHKKIDRSFQFLTDCRPHSISMGNAKQYLRQVISNLDSNLSEEAAKTEILAEIDVFMKERIIVAGSIIANLATEKIRDTGDVILTYGRSHAVEQILMNAHKQGKQFHVVVVEARAPPGVEGRGLLERLTSVGVSCTYVLLNAASYVMPQVTKVLLGAAAVMSNGAVLGRIGTAVVAMTAKSKNIPVIITCETYKLCEKVPLDSIVSNELGDPADLERPGESATSDPKPRLLNLRYDLTPQKFVGMVVTEVGLIPPTAVPALIREYRRDVTGEL
jgi:translation initiation factor eIF-2B subunit delta